MTLDLKITSGTSDLGFQVWTAVRLGISSLNSCQTSGPRAHESKIQDPSRNLGSGSEIQAFGKKSWFQGRNLGPRYKIQDIQKTFLGSRAEILDPNGIAGSKVFQHKLFKILDLGSWIQDPRFLPWIQDMFFENLGYWILIMSDLRFSSLNPFQTGDSQVTETGIKPKSKA